MKNLINYRRFLDFGWYIQFFVLDSLQSGKQIKGKEYGEQTLETNLYNLIEIQLSIHKAKVYFEKCSYKNSLSGLEKPFKT